MWRLKSGSAKRSGFRRNREGLRGLFFGQTSWVEPGFRFKVSVGGVSVCGLGCSGTRAAPLALTMKLGSRCLAERSCFSLQRKP